MPLRLRGRGAMRTIHAIGYSELGSFLDYQGDPVAVLVTPDGDIFLGESVIPGFPIASTISADRARRFELEPPPELGSGWVLQLKYGGEAETTLSLGLWTGPFSEITEWFSSANHMIRAADPRRDKRRAMGASAIDQIRQRGIIRAVPGWAISAAGGSGAGLYKRRWMGAYLGYVSKILAARYDDGTVPEATYVRREAQETWLAVFNRLLPSTEERKAERAIDVCFEPLFRSSQREATFDVAPMGYLTSFSVIFKKSSKRLKAFRAGLKVWREKARDSSVELFSGPAMETSYEAYLELFKETVLKEDPDSDEEPIVVHVQIGTIGHEISTELVTDGDLPGRRRNEVGDARRLVEGIREADDFVVFCDTILLSDITSRWDEQAPAPLEVIQFPLRARIPVGIPFATSDDEWGAVLREALYAVANDETADIRRSWLETLNDFIAVDIKIAEELQLIAGELVTHEQS